MTWENELKKNFDWMQKGDYLLLETFIEQQLKDAKVDELEYCQKRVNLMNYEDFENRKKELKGVK